MSDFNDSYYSYGEGNVAYAQKNFAFNKVASVPKDHKYAVAMNGSAADYMDWVTAGKDRALNSSFTLVPALHTNDPRAAFNLVAFNDAELMKDFGKFAFERGLNAGCIGVEQADKGIRLKTLRSVLKT